MHLFHYIVLDIIHVLDLESMQLFCLPDKNKSP